MRCTRGGAAGLLALVGLVLVAPQVEAQVQGVPADQERVAGEEMAAFAAAAQAVRRLRESEKVPVSARIRERMVEAVKAEGLSVERYNAIARRIRSDDKLFARYQQAWNRLNDDAR